MSATDGSLGCVVNFLVDDQRWNVRHMVVDTGGSLDGRRVLIPPASFREIDKAGRHFHLALTRAEVQESPKIDTDTPLTSVPGMLQNLTPAEAAAAHACDHSDAHLRSANAVRGYAIAASDGAAGHLADFIVDDTTWDVRYLAIDTRLWFGKKVLVMPVWVQHISWDRRTVYLGLTRKAIKASPSWENDAAIAHEYAASLLAQGGPPA